MIIYSMVTVVICRVQERNMSKFEFSETSVSGRGGVQKKSQVLINEPIL